MNEMFWLVAFGIVGWATFILIAIEQTKILRRIEMKVDELISQVDAATNAAADRVTKLIDAIKADKGTLSPEQEAEATAIVTHLQAIGADQSNPVPAAPPTTPV